MEDFIWEFIMSTFIASALIMSMCILFRMWWPRPAKTTKANYEITMCQESAVRERNTGWNISHHLNLSEIGLFFNKWRMPRSVLGRGEKFDCEMFETLDIDQAEWASATEAVDIVLDILLPAIKRYAANKYENLVIEKFVRQGSAREGLKVHCADEFDVLLLFRIDGLQLKVRPLTNESGLVLPEFCRLCISDDITTEEFKRNYGWLLKHDCISYDENIYRNCLNTRNLHEKVFISIIQSVSSCVGKHLLVNDGHHFHYFVKKFRKNPPSVNIEIGAEEVLGYSFFYGPTKQARYSPLKIPIDVDIVPGIQLSSTTVPDPTDWNKTMKCPRYAVFKWVDSTQSAAAMYDCSPEIRWRNCTSGFEKHVFDVARGSKEQCYIITALRIMKRKFQMLKEELQPPQLVTVLRSYYLKHIALYCILYLTVMNKAGLSGVREALAYFLDFLRVALEEKRLPHFFHNNDNILYMFPNYGVDMNTLRYDLFAGKCKDSLLQAEASLIKLKLKKIYCEGIVTYEDFAKTFRRYIQSGKYYQSPSPSSPSSSVIQNPHVPYSGINRNMGWDF